MLPKRTLIPILLLLASLGVGCSRELAPQDTDESSAQQLPFDRSADQKGISPTSTIAQTSIPSGTPITIRLQSAVSSASSHTGESFDAVLDEPLIINGQTVAPRGANVTGRIVSAKSSGHLQDPGYIRLTLITLIVNGKQLRIQTSTLFAKGNSHEKPNLAMIGGGVGARALIGGGGKGALIGTEKKDVGFSSARRLTFRLTQSVIVQG